MKYIKLFNTHDEYETYINGSKTVLPNVSFCEDAKDVHYNPWVPHDYSRDYLTFVALEDGTFSFYLGDSDTYMDSISYSIDNGETWVTYDGEDRDITVLTTPTITTGNKVLWKGVGKAVGYETSHFESTGRFNAQGNIMSLLYGDDFANKTQFDSEYQYQLSGLFEGTKVVDTSNLILPATTLADYCYAGMFNGCTSLTTAPELPATTLAYECYAGMFNGCTSLTIAPELPATTLASYCYYQMFSDTNVLPDCTNIDFSSQSVVASGGLQGLFSGTKITDAQLDAILKEHGINNYSLPVTTLADSCYIYMFRNCTSLTTAPELPATTLANYCYQQMFQGCTSLTTAPQLPATTLASNCYNNMFNGCTSLTTAPQLLATTLVSRCYAGMFRNCTSLTTAPELPATILAEVCYGGMFNGCTSLNSIKCLATDINARNCTDSWVSGVASSGTFIKAASMTSWTTGNNGIPSGWTVQDAA